MAFPEDYSGMRAEIFAGGRWINVIDTSDVRYESDVKITRGMRDAQTRASNTVCELVLDNRDGRYSPRNPISDLFGKIGNNTPLRIALPLITDAFGRTEVNGWGGPEVGGGGYTTAGAAASAFSVNSGEGHISLASLNNIQEAYLGSVLNRDVVVATDIYPNAIATGFAFDAGLTVRRTDASNYYSGRVIFYLSGIAFVEIYKHVAGVISQIATSVLETNDLFSYTASTQVRAEFIAVGSYLRIRAYDVGNPGTYAEASVNDSSLPYAGAIGVMCIMETGNTNSLPHVIDFDNFLRDDARCAVEIPSWPPRWDPTGTNIWVPINGHGVRDRLTQGAQALHSAYRRYVLQGGYSSEPDPVHYWPLEDSAGAQSAVDLFGDRPAHMLGTVSFASGDGPPGSASLPSISASGTPVNGLRYYVDRHSFELGDSWAWYLWMRGTGTDASCSPWVMSAEGSLPVWRLTVENTGTPTVVLNVYTRADIGTGDVLTMTCTVNANVLDGEWHLIVIEGFRVSDTNTQSFLTVDGDDPGSDFDTAVGFTSGSVSWSQTPSFVAMTNVDELQIGHVQFYAEETTVGAELEHVEAMQGWAGETAAARMQRLFEEEGIPFGLIGSADDTALVGPQRIATLMELADDCGDVDMGIGPYEAREFPGFIYRTRDNLYNQAPRVTLDYEAFDLFEVPEVTDDLQYVRNDITVTRDKGSSARSVLDDGSRLSISPPPTGIGTYDDPLTLTPHADSQLADLAGWLRHVKTNDEQRWPQLSLALERSPFTVDPVKTDSVRRSDLGDIAVIQNPPSFVTFDDVSLMFIGVTEILGRYKHQFNFNCTPSKP